MNAKLIQARGFTLVELIITLELIVQAGRLYFSSIHKRPLAGYPC